jgi:hypothetical protein
MHGLAVVSFLVLALLVPAAAVAQPIPGASYEGPVSGGGKVEFRVALDGKFVTRFRAEDVPGTLCEVEFIEATPSGDGFPISSDSFESLPLDLQFRFHGDFPALQQASGSLSIFSGGCITGTKSWTASTTATLPPPPPPRDKTPPALSLHYRHTQPAVRKRAIEVAVGCPTEECRIDAEAFVSLSNSKIYDLGSKRLYLAAGGEGTLKFKLKGRARAAVRKARRQGRHRLKTSIRLEARDSASPIFNRTERFLTLWVK